jgi:two-component system, OmpR family, sensor kinase
VLGRLSLKARLLLGVIVLSAIGLGAADVATYASLRSFLLERTDESLESLSAAAGLDVLQSCRGGPGVRPPEGASAGDFFQLRGPGGRVLCEGQVAEITATGALSPPVLPDSLDVPSAFTAESEDGEARYRVLVQPTPVGQTVVATSLDDVDATLRRLLVIMLLVTGVVLAALAGLALWVVRIGLRPLEEIGSTAAAIAAGDLSRRVERAEPRTEVGRLGLALNAMLGQIERAFEAQRASERKLRRFVADASHELRTPLSAVRAYAELFTRGAKSRPADLARSMHGIERESERMSALVEDLLLLARLDEGRPLEREPVQLDAVVGEAVETAQAVEPERPIELRAEPAAVLGDRDRLRQIVDNLLANVRAHTPADTPVSVRVARADGNALVEVADSGPGIDPDQVARVFERFYRTDSSRSRERGGVGLGLSIVAAVAEAHGGSVEAESEAGRGATFRITLPLAEDGGAPGRRPMKASEGDP